MVSFSFNNLINSHLEKKILSSCRTQLKEGSRKLKNLKIVKINLYAVANKTSNIKQHGSWNCHAIRATLMLLTPIVCVKACF